MDTFRIQVFEDDESDVLDIKLYMVQLNEKLESYKINVEADYSGLDRVKEQIQNCQSDLIILDLLDNSTAQYSGIDALKHNMKAVPTLIYSNTFAQIGFDKNAYQLKYKFLLDVMVKSSEGGDNLIDYLYNYILDSKTGSLCFVKYNDFDQSLSLGIDYIGESRFNSIVRDINNNMGLKLPIVYPMTLGYSGALLFKLAYDQQEYVLKLSKEIDKLELEHNNARRLYRIFPDRLLITIEHEKYSSFDNQIIGYFMKHVKDSETFLQYTLDSKVPDKISEKLHDLFLKPKGLKYHYNNTKSDLKDWSYIFNKMDEGKLLLVEKSYNEVKPIIDKIGMVINIDSFTRLVVQNNYENINKFKLLDEKYKKPLVLAHGDFHAKNIMVQDDLYIKIIDTGLMRYAHWTTDISRLIVNLLLAAVDYRNVNFFNVESIQRYIDILNHIINMNPIPLDNVNDNVFTAINWLVTNITIIYDDFEVFEYQLGLMKEFLQASYRFDTVPANRRAFALISADILMKSANANLKN